MNALRDAICKKACGWQGRATDDLHCVYVAWKTRKAVEESLSTLIDKKVLDIEEAIMVASKILKSNAANLYGFGDS